MPLHTKVLALRAFKPRQSYITYSLAVIAFMASIAYSLWTLPQSPNPEEQLTAILIHNYFRSFLFCAIGILIGTFFTILGYTIDVRSRLDDYGEVVKDLGTRLDNVVDCRYLGIGTETIAQVMGRVQNAKYVRNTFIFFGVPEHRLAASSYAENQLRETRESIKTFLQNGGHWTDIVSQDFSNSPTMNWLQFLADLKAKAEGGSEEAKAAKAALENYTILRLKGAYPVINFMILRYANGDQELIFGWGHHSEDAIGRVFLSTSRRLIDIFDSLWRVLEKDAQIVNPHVNRPISAVDVSGLWFRVSYRLVDEDHAARMGVPAFARKPNDDALFDIALVEIRTENNREITVTGRRFDIRNNFETTGLFTTFAADIKKSKLWFATTNSSKSMHVSVAGWYRFIRPKARGYKPFFLEEFFGEFWDFEPQTALRFSEMKAGKLILFGCRVPNDWLSDQGSGLMEHVPSDPADQMKLLKKGLEWWTRERGGRDRWTLADC